MKKQYFSLLLSITILLTPNLTAQVSNYTFNDNATSIPDLLLLAGEDSIFSAILPTEISQHPDAGRYLFMNTGSPSTDTVVSGPGYPIGFDFKYDGEVFDRVGISSNLFIKLGNSSNGNFLMKNDTVPGSIFESGYDSLRSNIIAPFQKESKLFNGYRREVYIASYGYPGEKKFVVGHYFKKQGSATTMDLITFIDEFSRKIYFGFYNFYTAPINFQSIFVGLRGSQYNNSSNNIFSRKIINGINTWSSSDSATTPSDSCQYSQNLKPSNSKVYSFTPPIDSIVPKVPIGYFLASQKHPQFLLAFNKEGFIYASNAIDVTLTPTLKWSPEFSPLPIYYDLYLGLDSLNLKLLADSLSNTEFDFPILTPNTTYYYQIIAYNDLGSCDTITHHFTTGNDMGYCIEGNGSSGTGGNATYESFDFNNLHYTHPTNPPNLDSTARYPAVAPYTTTLKRDTTYDFYKSIPPGTPCFAQTAWIDFNQNGVFTDPGERFPLGSTSQVVIPNTALLGETTLRITVQPSCLVNRLPCGRGTYQDFTVTIIPSTACQGVSIAPAVTPISCYGDSAGGIQLNPSGGATPYTVEWQKNGAFYSDSLLNDSMLSQGIYRAFVTDTNGCSVQTDLIPLVQPYPLQLDTQRNGNQYTIIAGGGTPPYTFEWKNIDTTISTSNPNDSLPNGTYQLTLMDSNHCQISLDSIRIQEPVSNPSFAVSTDTIFVNNVQGSSATFFVLANAVNWTLTEQASWLIVNPDSGTSTEEITVLATSRNTGENPRYATITASSLGYGDTSVVVVQDAATPLLQITPKSILLDGDSGVSKAFNITSNLQKWTITNDSSWIKVNPDSGSFTEQITVMTTEANRSGGARTGAVYVNAPPFNPDTVMVTQDTLWTIGINERQSNEETIKVFPNPSSGVFYIQSLTNSKIESAIVRDISGKKVMEKEVKQVNFQLDLKNNPKGIYWLQLIEQDKQQRTVKLIVM